MHGFNCRGKGMNIKTLRKMVNHDAEAGKGSDEVSAGQEMAIIHDFRPRGDAPPITLGAFVLIEQVDRMSAFEVGMASTGVPTLAAMAGLASPPVRRR